MITSYPPRSQPVCALFESSVLVTEVRPGTATRLAGLLSSQAPAAVRVMPLDDAIRTGAGTADLIIAVTGTSPIDDGAAAVRLLRSGPGVPVLIVSDLDDDAALLAALAHGAAGYLLTDVTGEALALAVERVLTGRTAFAPTALDRIASRLLPATPPRWPTLDGWGLRPRERQVLESLLAGRSNREIARDLNLGEETVKTYLRQLYRKVGARDRSQAIAIALRVR